MDGYQSLSFDQLQTADGMLVLNNMIRGLYERGQRAAFMYSLSASTSADAYAKWGETTATSSIGLLMPSKGSIVHHVCLANITGAVSGDMTVEIRVNDTNQAGGELEFNSSAGTGVKKKNVLIDRHAVSFTDDDLIQIYLNETGDMTWDSLLGYIEVLFDE